ncbi:molybdopterin biosynthesis protein [Palleronia sediminis]|uniref:Molybdopterin biosynthesis protein n=1 Tax=Palleronia sediminis TaxID=2547833 RepID=A0A4R6A9H2_9RHOB|nr:molybdopterin-binding protein [Palleronia sediminis]TDL79462.1 molybdopterin biosynthesis protein [Palleronia sediminis]
MEFGRVPLSQALGAILAHSQQVADGRIRKGCTLDRGDIARLAAAGISHPTVARLSPDDLGEDEAAARLAAALVPDPDAAGLRLTAAATGRVNLLATVPGVLTLDAGAIHALNRVDPAITLATLPEFARVAPGTMAATVKLITYAVPGELLERACAAARGALRVAPVRLGSAGLIVTDMGAGPGKGEAAVAMRLERLGMRLAETRIVPHDEAPLAEALAAIAGDMVLVLTASATSDARDVAPAALIAAGGRVDRFGIPVDPGNLLFLGALGGRPVIGLPGCARSPALNGADWVLERVACGIPPTEDAFAAMGVGGLLKESPARPHPRARGR